MNININTDENGVLINIQGVEIRVPASGLIESASPVTPSTIEKKEVESDTKKEFTSYDSEYIDHFQNMYMNQLMKTDRKGKPKPSTVALKEQQEEAMIATKLFGKAVNKFYKEYAPNIEKMVRERVGAEVGPVKNIKFDFQTLNGESIDEFFAGNASSDYTETEPKSWVGEFSTTLLNSNVCLGYFEGTPEETKITLHKGYEHFVYCIDKQLSKHDLDEGSEAYKLMLDIDRALKNHVGNQAVSSNDKRILNAEGTINNGEIIVKAAEKMKEEWAEWKEKKDKAAIDGENQVAELLEEFEKSVKESSNP